MASTEKFAVVAVGECAVALEAAQIAAILDDGDEAASATQVIDLHALIGAETVRDAGDARLLCLAPQAPADGAIAVRVCGRIAIMRLSAEPCFVPALIAGALRRRCLRGVVCDDDRLFYVLDTGAVFARARDPLPDGEAICASD